MIFSEAIVNCCDPIINAYEKTGILSGIGNDRFEGGKNKKRSLPQGFVKSDRSAPTIGFLEDVDGDNRT